MTQGRRSCWTKFWTLIGAILLCSIIVQSGAFANALGIPDSEYKALVAFYNSTNGSGWTDKTNWLTDATPWHGITVANDHVTGINLCGNHLAGSLPAEIANLTELESLSIMGNQLTGNIPDELGNLTNLRDLELNSNRLSGSIPASIGNLKNLIILELTNNQLTGPLPSELGQLTSLKILYLNQNTIDGSIPASLGSLSSGEMIDLSYNQLSGSIPGALGNISTLKFLSLYENQLTGSIPAGIGNATSLRVLYLYNNQLSGSIPAELGNLDLYQLILRDNQLSGAIPASLGQMSNLYYLSLANNQLSGPIPTELGNLATVGSLDLNSNHLTGTIPPELFGLTNLTALNLGNNKLSGTIPSEVGKASKLFSLGLSSNQLSGEVPASIVNLTNCWSVNLAFNRLTSTDPAVISFLKNKYCYLPTTQTVPPTNVVAMVCTNGDIALYWKPVIFDSEEAELYYEIGYGSSANGPFTFDPANRINDRLTSSKTLKGLDARGPLFLVMRTVSLAGTDNQSTLISELSTPVEATPIGNNALGISDEEYVALKALYYSTNGGGWTDKTNWLSSNDSWYGVTVEDGHVTSIDLAGNNLQGQIPTQIGDLVYLQHLNLSGNQLNGSIPAEIGNLSNLQYLDLGWCYGISGPLPVEIGNLTALMDLYLGANQLSGPIPAEIGNLTNLERLDLQFNCLSGQIPAEILQLTNLKELYLSYNQLSGSIPAEIGNLTSLEVLFIDNNLLVGEVPSSITNMTNLACIMLEFNGLFSADPNVVSFLQERGCDLTYCQVLPPINIMTEVVEDGIAISWSSDPVTPLMHYGEVGYSYTSGGPYTYDEANVSYDEFDATVTIKGLDLTKPIYFVVRTVYFGVDRGPFLTSVPSEQVGIIPSEKAKMAADGIKVNLEDMVVTATWPDFFYVETKDRSWGMKIDEFSLGLEPGMIVGVRGKIRTDENGERFIERADFEPSNAETADIKPVYMTNRSLGGSNWQYDQTWGCGQRGVEGGFGLNNIGLLVKTTGTVTYEGDRWCYIDDGSNLNDGSGYKGLLVYGCTFPKDSKICVTGISTCEKQNDHIVRKLLSTEAVLLSPQAQ